MLKINPASKKLAGFLGVIYVTNIYMEVEVFK